MTSSQKKFQRAFKREMSIETLKGKKSIYNHIFYSQDELLAAKAFFVFQKKVNEYLSDSEIEDSILECNNASRGENGEQNEVSASSDGNQKKTVLSATDPNYGLCKQGKKKTILAGCFAEHSNFPMNDHRKFSQGSSGASAYDSSQFDEGLDFEFTEGRDEETDENIGFVGLLSNPKTSGIYCAVIFEKNLSRLLLIHSMNPFLSVP